MVDKYLIMPAYDIVDGHDEPYGHALCGPNGFHYRMRILHSDCYVFYREQQHITWDIHRYDYLPLYVCHIHKVLHDRTWLHDLSHLWS